MLTGQLVALREAITGYTGIDTLLTRALPVWGESTLLGPAIAGLAQLFRPQPIARPARVQPPQPALPADPATLKPLNDVAQRLTLPSPAVKPGEPPQESPGLAS